MDMRKLGMEALGSFIFILVACTTGNPLAMGVALALVMYVGVNISGGHFNPAISLAMFLRGRLPKGDLIPYVLAQLAGGVAAALIAFMITHEAPVIQVGPGGASLGRRWGFIHGAITGEFIGTFFLALVFLVVLTSRRHANNNYYGACVGGAFFAIMTAFAPVSGGAFNPALGLSQSIIGLFNVPAAIQWFWVYLIFPPLGAWVAVLAFNYLFPDEAVKSPAFTTTAAPATATGTTAASNPPPAPSSDNAPPPPTATM